jgi:hypothetical protein
LEKTARKSASRFVAEDLRPAFYVHRIPYNFVKAFDFVPYFWNETDGEKKSEDYKPYYLKDPTKSSALLAIYNSNLFFWWWYSLFEGYHCGKHEIYAFPAGIDVLQPALREELDKSAKALMKDMRKHGNRKKCNYRNTGEVVYDEFFPRLSKTLIDDIDGILAKHYGISSVELDYIVNYDAKFRTVGHDDAAEDG